MPKFVFFTYLLHCLMVNDNINGDGVNAKGKGRGVYSPCRDKLT